MEMFDLLVLGGGPGGYLCAERAAQNGMKVALFEKKSMGGTCLNEGCIPTKTLLHSAKMYRHARHSAQYGVSVDNVSFDHAKVIARKDQVVQTLVAGVKATMKANKVTVIPEKAVICGRKDSGFIIEAAGQMYSGRRLAIASGSETIVPPVPGLQEGLRSGFVVTNKEILEATKLPEKLVVIGGGVIGLEMAYYFASVGVSVVVIEMMPKIAGATDPEICKVIESSCTKNGMQFLLSAKVLEVKKHSVVYEQNGEQYEIPCDMVLLSAGRKPATSGLGLETINLQMDRAAIVVDRHMCTNVSGVYAIGDCNGKMMLAHVAYREAEVAVNHMVGIADEMRYDVVPSVIYTDPEVASVGMSKDAASQKGIQVKEVKLPMTYAGRYLAESADGNGFIKLVIDTQRNRLVGCHMVGPYASEIIMTATMMVDTELTPKRLQKLVFPHPTVAEIIREAIFRA